MNNIKQNIMRNLDALELYSDLKKVLSFQEYEESIVDLYLADSMNAGKLTYIKEEIEIFIENNREREFGFILPKKADLDNVISVKLFKEEYGKRININPNYFILLPYEDCATIDISKDAASKAQEIAWIALDTEYTNDNLRILSIHNHVSELLLGHPQSVSRDNLRVLLYDTPTSYCYNKWSFSTALTLVSKSTNKELVELAYLCDCAYSAIGMNKEEYAAATQQLNKSNSVLALECSYSYQNKNWRNRKTLLESYIKNFSFKDDVKKFFLNDYKNLREDTQDFEFINNYFREINNNEYAEFEQVYKVSIQLNNKLNYTHKEIRNIVEEVLEQKHKGASYEVYSSTLKDTTVRINGVAASRCELFVNYRLV